MPPSQRGPTWPRWRLRSTATDARLRGLPGLLALADHHELVSRVENRLDVLEAFADEIDHRIESGIVGADDIEAASATLVDAARRDVGDPPRPAAHCAGGVVARRTRRVGRCDGRLPRRPAGSVGDRPARGSGPRLGRAPPLRLEPRARRSRSERRWLGGRARWRSVVPVRVRPLDRGLPVVRLQGGRRDRRARRQHQSAPCRGRERSGAAACPRCGRASKSPSSVTRAGRASASSPSPTPIRSTAKKSSGGAERTLVRTSSPRSTATSTTTPTCASSTDCGSTGRSPPTPR